MTAYAMLLGAGSGGVVLDDYFKYVTMLLPGNGTNGAQNNTFLDSSTNNFTITRNGNTTQGTFTPYGANWSMYINGGEANAGSDASFSFGTGAYTVELWIFQSLALSAYSAGKGPIFIFNDATGGFGLWNNVSTGITIDSRSGGTVLASSTQIPTNQWNHVVAVRSGTGSGQTSIFLNGTRIANGTDATNWTVTGPLKIGGISTGGYYAVGNISNVRVVKGSAVYDPTQSTLTVPTSPLTAVSGTSLLTIQSNRLIDNSTNNFTVTGAGSPTPTIQRFSPFSPTAAYSAATIGGSGYFDRSGDYLSVPASSSWNIGGNDFTIEGWIYPTVSDATDQFIIAQYPHSNVNSFYIGLNSGNWQVYIYTNGSAYTTVYTGAAPKINQWTHFALVRNGATTNFYVNGTSVTSLSSVNMYYNASATIGVGAGTYSTGEAFFQGYISDIRIVNGSAVYTANFTPATSPLTAVTNTKLLLNMQNAGVIDNAMMNDLETVGNAQISTTQSKFGGSSIAFDGVGDYLKSNAATSDLCTFGTGDFTIEMWIYLTNVSVAQVIFDTRPASTNGVYPDIYFNNSGSTLNWYISSADRITSSAVSINTWYHVAVCRSGSSTKMFINGTQAGSTYTDTNNYLCAAQRPIIGVNATDSSSSPFYGYIDDLRVTKGYARYTANFTAPTAAFPTS